MGPRRSTAKLTSQTPKKVLQLQSAQAYEELEELPDEQDYSHVHLNDKVFFGYEEQKIKLKRLISNAIGNGESGTVLVYGGQGSGKTEFVNRCLQESELAQNCRILKLSGLIHGNDVSTVHHIATFLDIKLPDLPRIMEKFKEDCQKRIANLIVVLDEFDEFCDKNQFLLYNFFDLIQYVGYMVVIGISTRYDCVELLEKRVKSRMNHQIIGLESPFQNLREYLLFAKRLLNQDVKFTKQFQHNLEIQYSKSSSIAKLKSCLLQNLRPKQLSTVNSLPVQTYLSGKDEKVSLICKYLTNLEICVLLLAAKLVYLKELEHFNLNFLFGLIGEIPTQIPHNKKLLFMATGILIDYDLFVIEEKKTLRAKKLYLTEWTPLILNVFKFQIDDALKRMEKKLPTGVPQLFSIQKL